MRHGIVVITIALLIPTAVIAGPCTEDKLKFCKEVKAAGGDVGACIREHIDELSAACKAKQEAASKEKQEVPAEEKP